MELFFKKTNPRGKKVMNKITLEQTTLIFNNKYDIDIFNPDDLYKINIVISNLFSLGCNSKQLINDLNDLLTIQTLMIKKHFFLTNI